MSLHKSKPTSAGRRFQVAVKTPGLHKGKPHSALVDKKSKSGGRNNTGRITVRHHGGGHKQRYRIIDFKRDKDGIPAVVERLEYDPNRSAHIALVKYADGERRYILAPKGIAVGAPIVSGEDSPIKPGSALSLKSIPVGTVIHNIEMKPGKGGLGSVCWWFSSACGTGRRVRNGSLALRRDAQDPHRLSCDGRRSGTWRT